MEILAAFLRYFLSLIENKDSYEYINEEHREYWERLDLIMTSSAGTMVISIIIGLAIGKMIEVLVTHFKNRKTHFTYIPYYLHYILLFVASLQLIFTAELSYSVGPSPVAYLCLFQDFFLVFMIMMFIPSSAQLEDYYFCQRTYYWDNVRSFIPLYVIHYAVLQNIIQKVYAIYDTEHGSWSDFLNLSEYSASILIIPFSIPLLIWKNKFFVYVFYFILLTYGSFFQEWIMFLCWIQGIEYWR